MGGKRNGDETRYLLPALTIVAELSIVDHEGVPAAGTKYYEDRTNRCRTDVRLVINLLRKGHFQTCQTLGVLIASLVVVEGVTEVVEVRLFH